jgi:hypothetical protein
MIFRGGFGTRLTPAPDSLGFRVAYSFPSQPFGYVDPKAYHGVARPATV